MIVPGSQILIYPILWILMPSEQPLAPTAPVAPAAPARTPAPFGPTQAG
jgi:hypothetical protein